MDLLADVLSSAGIQKRLIHQRSYSSQVALRFPCEKSFGFHVVLHGRAFIHQTNKTPISLERGDIAFLSRGCDHIVSTSEKKPSKVTDLPLMESSSIKQGKANMLSLVSGAYQVWHDPVHPFFSEIPNWFVLKADDRRLGDDLQFGIHFLSREIENPSFGSTTIANGLLDVLFSLILRRILDKKESEPRSWCHGLSEAPIRNSIELMHSDCARSWSLNELAKSAGLSRAAYAQKFKMAIGVTPFHYLTTLRVQKAMERLSTSNDKLELVAESVGYQDAFAFSKVFKRETGVSPRDFRNKNKAEKNLPWRF